MQQYLCNFYQEAIDPSLCLGLDLGKDQYPDPDQDPDLALDPDPDQDLDLTSAPAIDQDQDQDPCLIQYLDPDLDPDLGLDPDLDPDLDLDIDSASYPYQDVSVDDSLIAIFILPYWVRHEGIP